MKHKRKQNEIEKKDTLIIGYFKDKAFHRFEKDFDLDYINTVGRKQCEQITIDSISNG